MNRNPRFLSNKPTPLTGTDLLVYAVMILLTVVTYISDKG